MRDYKYGDFYFDSQHDKQMKIEVPGIGITIDNSMIEQEAFEMNETLCSESELKFGRCEANSVKFTVHGMPRSIKGEKISISEVTSAPLFLSATRAGFSGCIPGVRNTKSASKPSR